MLFKVSNEYKGSLILNTLKHSLKGGQTIFINDQDLTSSDVKAAIKSKILIPMDEETYSTQHSQRTGQALIVNRTDKIIVLGQISLKPYSSIIIDEDKSYNGAMGAAEKAKIISITRDNNFDIQQKSIYKENIQQENILQEDILQEDFIAGEDRKVEPVVWNFNKQKVEKAEKIISSDEIINVDDENGEDDNDDIAFIDNDKKGGEDISFVDKVQIEERKSKRGNNSDKKKIADENKNVKPPQKRRGRPKKIESKE